MLSAEEIPHYLDEAVVQFHEEEIRAIRPEEDRLTSIEIAMEIQPLDAVTAVQHEIVVEIRLEAEASTVHDLEIVADHSTDLLHEADLL